MSESAPSPRTRKPSGDLTVAQAQDLARHFLGKEWRVSLSGSISKPYMLTNGHRIYGAGGWRSLFRMAGVALPFRPQFSSQGGSVLMGEKPVATAISNNMARRIAAALNEYEVSARGV